LTIEALASEMGRSTSTISYWLKRYGLELERARRSLTITPSGEAFGTCRVHGESRFVRRNGDAYYRCAKCRSADVMRRRRRVKTILVQEAGGACRLCGYDKYAGALHFHHLDAGSKEFSLGQAGITRSIEAARAEARKCVLLCSNCHAEVEAGIVRV
jgi:hypothetical protein